LDDVPVESSPAPATPGKASTAAAASAKTPYFVPVPILTNFPPVEAAAK
jgi:hypothetical protein